MGLREPMRQGRRRMLLVPAVTLAVLAGPLVACGSSGSAGTAATSSSPAATGGTVSAAASFVSIVEPFDPGHPARTAPAPARCGSQTTTIEIEQCYQTQTENVDVQ